MVFHNSGIDFWRQNPSKINCKMTSKIAYTTFNPLWPENPTQDTSKTLPRRPHDAPRGPITLQDVPKTALRRFQGDPKTPPRRGSKSPKTPQNASKTPQDAPRPPPRRLQTSISGDCWSIFGPFFDWFWIDFYQMFIDFFHCISVTLLLNYMRSWRGGGDAALLRFGFEYL